jgi:hypothetical protein
MQSFILPLVHALWPNDILAQSHVPTVAPVEITALINPSYARALIIHSHKRQTALFISSSPRKHITAGARAARAAAGVNKLELTK